MSGGTPFRWNGFTIELVIPQDIEVPRIVVDLSKGGTERIVKRRTDTSITPNKRRIFTGSESVLLAVCPLLVVDLPKKSGREEKRSMLTLEESIACRKNVVSLVPSRSVKP